MDLLFSGLLALVLPPTGLLVGLLVALIAGVLATLALIVLMIFMVSSHLWGHIAPEILDFMIWPFN